MRVYFIDLSHARHTKFSLHFCSILHSFYVINGLLLIRISDPYGGVVFFDVDPIFSLDYNSLPSTPKPPAVRARALRPTV